MLLPTRAKLQTGLGSRIGELAHGTPLHDTRDRGDVDHARGITWADIATLSEQWKEGCGGEELCGQVRLEGLRPVFGLTFPQMLGDTLCRSEVRLAVAILGRLVTRNSGFAHISPTTISCKTPGCTYRCSQEDGFLWALC